ncbi:MAG: hypothetical protein K2H86_07550 [Muribaculaceae bacterium]|nr:hypothetical protein [Muribaculaceae bacterium]
MEIITAILGSISIPIYVLCVLLLLAIAPIVGGYVNASVYVCEYCEPVVTGAITLLFLIFCGKYIYKAIKKEMYVRAIILIIICVVYISVLYNSIGTLMLRVETYRGMTNKEIFDYVVIKLREMGSSMDGTVDIIGHKIGVGYIVANFMTYVLPISVTLWCGLIQRIISKKLR